MDTRLTNADWLKEQYGRMSMQAIADMLGVHRNTVRNRLIHFGIERHPKWRSSYSPKTPEHRGKLAAARRAYWRANPATAEFKMKISRTRATTRNVGGYRTAYDPEYPDERREHRLVIEQALGRRLQSGEVVHHMNSVRTDNRTENLMVFSSHAEHMRWHYRSRRIDTNGRFVKD